MPVINRQLSSTIAHYPRRNRWAEIFVCCILGLVAGCQNPDIAAKKITSLTQEKEQLQKQVKQSTAENEQLRKQVQTLAGLKPETRFANLYNLQKIKLTGYTGFYDKDKDGKKEKLIVYIQPIDEDGDVVKATGSVDVQLWDLNKKNGEALLGEWHVEPAELKKMWFATVIIINYRLTFDISDKIAAIKDPLTVKVTFTDYLSGRVMTEQKVIEPN